jgi:molecular chaperone DnaK (HSP70)
VCYHLILADLVIAIDFGSTYSGVAYVYNKQTKAAPRSLRRILNDIQVVMSWPHGGPFYKEKTPTILAYNTTPPKWGDHVGFHDEPRKTNFKFGSTDPTQQGAEQYGSHTSNLYPNYDNFLEAVDFTTDYLTCLFKYVTQNVLQDIFGAKSLQSRKISYIVTVPAIWSDHPTETARALTKFAASTAFGISGDQSPLVLTEPEAAARFCVSVFRDEEGLDEGSRILICDAGGTTVVFLTFEDSKILGPHHVRTFVRISV